MPYTDRVYAALYDELDPDPYSFDESRLCPSPPAQRMPGRRFPMVPTGSQMNSCCGNTLPFLVKMITTNVFNLYEYRGL